MSTLSLRKIRNMIKKKSRVFIQPVSDEDKVALVEEKLCTSRKKNNFPNKSDDNQLPPQFQPGNWSKYELTWHRCHPREGFNALCFENEVFLFGGKEFRNEIYLSDVRVFDFKRKMWVTRYASGNIPNGRSSFAMCKAPSKRSFVVSGGVGSNRVFGDMFEYDIETSNWKLLQTDTDGSHCKFHGHSMCSYGDNLYFFGGSTGTCYSNATYEFHLPSKTWRTIVTTGKKPSPRYQHTANVVRDCMVIIGGGNYQPNSRDDFLQVFMLNLKTFDWSTLDIGGAKPCARVLHITEYDIQSGRLFVGGGADKNLQRLKDCYMIDLTSPNLVWQCITPLGVDGPDEGAFRASCFCDDTLWLLRGSDREIGCNDIWQYKHRATPPSLQLLSSLKVMCDSNWLYSNGNEKVWNLPPELMKDLSFNF